MDARLPRPAVVIAILLLAFVLRGGVGWWWQARLGDAQRFAFGDSASYWSLGRAIATGRSYEYGPGPGKVFRTPGYPVLLAPLFWLAGESEPPVIWARLLGAVLGTGAVAGVMVLASLLHHAKGAAVAGLLAAVYPGGIATSILVLSEAPYSPLVVAQVACWGVATRAVSGRVTVTFAILTGLVHGMATLMRPSHLLFVPFVLALAILSPARRRHWVIGAWILVASMAALAPWWWRNYQVTGRFVATTLQLGASLYDGWNPAATGASDMRFVDDFVAAQRREDEQSPAAAGTFEERLDARLRRESVAWARQHPSAVLRLAGTKLFRMWSPVPNASEMQGWLFRAAIFCSFTPIFLAAVAGSVRGTPRDSLLALCWFPALYLTALHLIFVSSIRYREPAMLPLIAVAAGYVSPWLPSGGSWSDRGTRIGLVEGGP